MWGRTAGTAKRRNGAAATRSPWATEVFSLVVTKIPCGSGCWAASQGKPPSAVFAK